MNIWPSLPSDFVFLCHFMASISEAFGIVGNPESEGLPEVEGFSCVVLARVKASYYVKQ